MANQDLSLTLKFENRKLIHDNNNTDYKERCLPLKIEKSHNHFYRALDYPVKVPVFYLLGENDGATDLEQGLKHADFVAKSSHLKLVMKDGGHLPNLGLLKDNRQCDPSEELDKCDSLKQNVQMINIFEKIIRNQVIDSLDIDKFNASGSLKWIFNYSKI
jgi:hypothetical protein